MTNQEQTVKTIIGQIRALAQQQNLEEMVEAAYQLDDCKASSFKERQIKETILNMVERAYDGDKSAYRQIVKECDQL